MIPPALGKLRPMQRAQKITLGEMRESGPTRLIVYCGDYCKPDRTKEQDWQAAS